MPKRRALLLLLLAALVVAIVVGLWPALSGPEPRSTLTREWPGTTAPRPTDAPRPAALVGREPAAQVAPAVTPEPPPADACVVEGLVVFADGKPAAGTAVQALFAEDTPSEGTRTFGEGVVTGDDGRFRLLVAGSGPALIVAARRDAKPTALPATVAPGTRVDAGTLRLSSGATLAGRVKCGGVPKEKITVIATWYGTTKEGTRPAKDGHLWVEDGRAIWSQVETHPDDDGKFRIAGLENGPYRLRVPAEDWGCALHPDAYAQVDFLTHAPDEHVTVDADRSLMVIEVADGDHLVQNAIVTLDGRDQIRLNSNTNGEVGLVLQASHRHRVTIEAAGYAPAGLDVTAGEAGSKRRERIPVYGEPGGKDDRWRAWLEGLDERVGIMAQGPDGVNVVTKCRVFDRSMNPVPARFVDFRASVQVVSTERLGVGTLTYLRAGLPDGTYTVEIGGEGFGTIQEKVTLYGSQHSSHWHVVNLRVR